jgi:hypothetical protein
MLNYFKALGVISIVLLFSCQYAWGKTFLEAHAAFCKGIHNYSECAKKIERSQLPKYSQLVKRKGNTLYLSLRNGNVIKLKNSEKECTISTICGYEFLDYLPQINYFLINFGYYEGGGVSMINQKSGERFDVGDMPILSLDNERFVVLDLDAYSSNSIIVYKFTEKSIKKEYTLKPESYLSDCDAEWINNSTIRIYWKENDKKKNVFKQFFIKLSSEGWQKVEEK